MKKMTMQSTALALFAGATLCAAQLAADTVAWWRFGDGEVGTVATSLTNEVDATGLTGAAHSIDASKTLDVNTAHTPYFVETDSLRRLYDPVSGKTFSDSTALYFPGDDSGNGGLVVVEDDSALHLETFTLEFFFKWEGSAKPNWRTLIGKKHETGTSFCLRLHQDGDHDTIAVWFDSADGGKATANCGKDISLSDGKWHHVAMKVYEQDGAWKASIYVDYRHVGSPTLPGPICYSGSRPLFIGGDPSAGSGRFTGAIDEVRLSNTLLGEDKFLRTYAVSSNADADTALYLDFSSDTIANQVPNESPDSVAAILKGDTARANDVPGERVRASAFTAVGAENGSALHLATNAESPHFSGRVTFDDTKNRVSDGSFTAEMFFKVDEIGTAVDSSDDCVYLFCAPVWKLRIMRNDGYLSGYFPGEKAAFSFGPSVTDGVWHHVALVYDQSAAKVRIYLDYALKNELTVGSFATSATYLTTIAGNMWDTGEKYQMSNGAIDEVRITRRILKPAEFLTVNPYSGGKLIDLTYEENVVDSVVNGNLLSKSWINSATNLFELSTRVPGVTMRDAAGKLVRESNVASLHWDNCYLAYDFASILDRSDFTLEFFLNANPTKATAGVMRLVDNQDVNDFVWGIRTDSTGTSLEVIASTEAEPNKVVASYPADSLDGAWHHYAANFKTVEGNTVLTLYRDYEKVVESTLSGVLSVATGMSRFYVGGGSAGYLDELIVWDGEKAPDDFQRVRKGGLKLIVR